MRAPGSQERAFFVGATGSGKTTLACELLKLPRYAIALDTKGFLTPKYGWQGWKVYERLADVIRSRERRIIYRPGFRELRDVKNDSGAINAFFAMVYEARNRTCYVDEIYDVAYRQDIPPYYHALLTRGRQRGISTWSATQRPMDIPQVVMSEAEHYYVFRMKLPQDYKKLFDITGIPTAELATLKDYQFYYANNRSYDVLATGLAETFTLRI